MSEFIYNPRESDFQAIGAVKGAERVARLAEGMDGEAYDVELEEGRDCLMCEGKSGWARDSGGVTPWMESIEVWENCPHCHGRGWLKACSYEPRPLFSVREMSVPGAAFGVRHDESGFWWPFRLPSRAAAERVRDVLTCSWCAGEECVLAEQFATLPQEEQS